MVKKVQEGRVRKDTHPAHNIWKKMRNRCYNEKNQDYKYYGGKGIRVCKRWDDFWNFVDDMGERPSPKHTLERIDYTKDYCKENCTWATIEEQNRNKSSLRYAYHNGKLVCATEWAKIVGISHKTACFYLNQGKERVLHEEITDRIAEKVRKRRGIRTLGAGTSPAPGTSTKE